MITIGINAAFHDSAAALAESGSVLYLYHTAVIVLRHKRPDAHRPFRSLTCRFSDVTGAARTISISGTPLFTDTGVFAGYRGTASDLTASVEAEQRMNLAEAKLAAAIATDPDDPANDPAFWERAELVYPTIKERVTLRLDRDVLAWFRSQGQGYQTRINAVLRAYMAAGRKAG